VNILGLPRPGYPLNAIKDQPPSFSWLSGDEIEGASLVTAELSSSEIRSRIRTFGDSEREMLNQRDLWSVEGLLPPAVIGHIIRNDLYMNQ
jgi:hypothetical protein